MYLELVVAESRKEILRLSIKQKLSLMNQVLL